GAVGGPASGVGSRAGGCAVLVVGAPARRLDLVQRWGASAVVSVEELPTAEARLARVRELTGGLGADVVFELSGAPYAFAEGMDFLRPGGGHPGGGHPGRAPPPPPRPALLAHTGTGPRRAAPPPAAG